MFVVFIGEDSKEFLYNIIKGTLTGVLWVYSLWNPSTPQQ